MLSCAGAEAARRSVIRAIRVVFILVSNFAILLGHCICNSLGTA